MNTYVVLTDCKKFVCINNTTDMNSLKVTNKFPSLCLSVCLSLSLSLSLSHTHTYTHTHTHTQARFKQVTVRIHTMSVNSLYKFYTTRGNGFRKTRFTSSVSVLIKKGCNFLRFVGVVAQYQQRWRIRHWISNGFSRG
jgi:hypothetical protein